MAKCAADHPAAAVARTLPELWRDAIDRHASRPLLLSDEDGSVFSYEDAGKVVAALAARLSGCGLRKGDRVCIVSPFQPEAAFVFWAATGIGAVVAPLDHRLPDDAIAALCAQVEPTILFCSLDRAGFAASSDIPAVLFDDAGGQLPVAFFADWLHEPATSPVAVDPPVPGDPAAILFTSGTSGSAKGVVLSSGALCGSGALMAGTYDWRPDDVLMSLGELHTMSGLRNPCVAALHAGGSFVVAAPAVRSNGLLASRCIERHRVSLLACVPAMLKQLARFGDRIGPGSLASLRLALCTGSSLLDAVVGRFEELFGVPVMNYYGLTETAGLCTGVVPWMTGSRPRGIGMPLGCQIRIVDSEGAPSADGVIGELLVGSGNLMSCYWRDRQQTERVLRDGWFRTGDLVRQAPDGFLHLVDRQGEAFKDSRGEFIHPDEIEQALELHPRVDEAGVCCYATGEGDNVIAAFIVARDRPSDWDELEAELRLFVAEKLGTHLTPTRIRPVDSLPRGTNEKLLRRKLREFCHDQ